MRETLRKAASELFNASQSPNPLYTEKMLALAASLRALADRWDAEEKYARKHVEHQSYYELTLLARLDAPVPPGEPGATCGTCRGARKVRKDCRGCFHEAHFGPCFKRNGGTAYQCPCIADTQDCFKPCPACATPSPPRSPEAKACAPWCGTGWHEHEPEDHEEGVWQGRQLHDLSTLCFCTLACRDAGKPLNPSSAWRERR